MSLADYAGGNYLNEGDHDVTIKGFRFFTFNSGSRGVEFELADRSGRGINTSFCLVESILWRLAGFAEACGLDKAAMGRIDPKSEKGFQVFTGKRVCIVCAKGKENAEGKRYTEVVDWKPVGTEVMPPPRPAQTATEPEQQDPEPEPQDTGKEFPVHDDIPF